MTETNEQKLFNPSEHLMKIGKGDQAKDYLAVQWRLVWFRSLNPQGTIETELVHLDLDRETEEEVYAWNSETRRSEKTIKRANGFAICRAVVKDGRGGVAMGTKSEKAASFADFLEKAETGAIGRALAALGYGTQFTGEEFDEQHRIVDAPLDRGASSTPAAPVENTNNGQRPAASNNQRVHPAKVESDRPAREAQPDAVKQMVTNAQKRAKDLGIAKMGEWNQLVTDALGAMKTTDQISLQDIAKINGALTQREKEKQPA